jgi:sigma-B regulation protein RsbU (phosphoserine phosphatase)
LSILILLPPLTYATIASLRFIFLEKRAGEREKELEAARTIQQKLLPTGPPAIPELEVAAVNIPALEIGGDYYDWVTLSDGSVLVTVADVSGKGVSAALLMSHLQASFHAEASAETETAPLVSAIDASLFRSTGSDRYATGFFVRLFPHTGSLQYCNAGHNPALLIRDGSLQLCEPTGPALATFEDAKFEQRMCPFTSGDLLVIYSDGITEATSRLELYGEERLQALAARLAVGPLSAQGIVGAILEDVRAFSHDSLGSDDATVVVIRRR